MFDLIIFDCDGVLVDSEKISIPVLADMLNELGWNISVDECRSTFMGKSMKSCLDIIQNQLTTAVPQDFLANFDQRVFKRFHSELEEVPGISTILNSLNIPSCVASSGPHHKMDLTLGLTKLKDHFKEVIFSAQDVERGKPFPDLFLHAAKSMNVAPQRCVVIEDSLPGLEAAERAGMQAVLYDENRLHKKSSSKYHIHCYSELPALLPEIFS
ncbi:MAG: HAD family hydrolase [Lentisphaeraceae bacterium]|nr:HAD family hydrolase [Lentisphaeraceae bacterium]